MTLLQKLETGMSERRAELINQPLARCWGELAKRCYEVMLEVDIALAKRLGWIDDTYRAKNCNED